MVNFAGRVLFIIVIVMYIVGCQAVVAYNNDLINGKPYWYWQPTIDGKIGGVGEAGTHVNGTSAQRQLAVQRALEDIARQKGVRVYSVAESYNKYTNSENSYSGGVKRFYSTSSKTDTFSIHTVDGTFITATVKEYWRDPASGQMVVWMVVDE